VTFVTGFDSDKDRKGSMNVTFDPKCGASTGATSIPVKIVGKL